MLDRMISQPILELQNVNKSFGHVQANKNISLKVNKGDIHGIIGENGAGKSTAMKAMLGMISLKEGSLMLDGLDISKLTPSIINSALSQAFFSLSLGMGILITYGSYMDRNTDIKQSAKQITLRVNQWHLRVLRQSGLHLSHCYSRRRTLLTYR